MNGQFDITGKVAYNGGTLIMEAGADMAKERDLKREWELEKARTAGKEYRVVCKIPTNLADDFAKRCEQNNTTKNAVLKNYIQRYTYDNFDQ